MKGSIRKRGDSWQIIYELPRDTAGSRKQGRQTVHGTKRDADAKLREILTALDKGAYITPTKETLGAFLVHWLEAYGATNTSPRTLKDYRGIVRRYLIPVLGDTPLVALRPGHVQDLYAYMQGRGLSPLTILHTHRLLREAISYAVKWGLLGRNVCDSATPPRPARTEMAAMDAETVERFETACEVSAFGDLFKVALRTGLRRSEILALKWDSVDLEKRTLRVVAGLHRLPQQGMVLLPTKTAKSRRQISFSQEVVDILRSIRGSQLVSQATLGPAWNSTGYVFTRPDGRCLDPEAATRAFTAMARSIGRSDLHFHSLRHTHASLMLAAGVHPKVVSERLGHSSISVTMDIYSHVLPGLQEDAVDRLEKLLARSRV
ncbi:MAG: site-specific integrase [Dehalococcoidia bacterium]|nr:site-specific integrase [Dehalococcoidia bacterium]